MLEHKIQELQQEVQGLKAKCFDLITARDNAIEIQKQVSMVMLQIANAAGIDVSAQKPIDELANEIIAKLPKPEGEPNEEVV